MPLCYHQLHLEMGLPVDAVHGIFCAESVCNGPHPNKQFHSRGTFSNFPTIHVSKLGG